MSRSRRKTPIGGFCGASSEKNDKKMWHSRMRARERDKLIKVRNIRPEPLLDMLLVVQSSYSYMLEDYITTLPNDVSDIWDMAKDGKGNFSDLKYYNIKYYNKLMRK